MKSQNIISSMTPVAYLSVSRMRAVKIMPYMAHALLNLIPVQTEKVPTMGVSEDCVLYYNPNYIKTIEVEEVAGVLLHEVMHLLHDHAGRRIRGGIPETQAYLELWNIAADFEINSELQDMCKLPPGAFPTEHGYDDGLSAEQYYNLLMKDIAKHKKKGGDEGRETPGTNSVGSGSCGSCVTGKAEDYEGTDGKGNSIEGRSETELSTIRLQTAKDVQKHNKSHGNTPDSLTFFADNLLKKPTIPWQSKLRKTIRNAVNFTSGCVDYKYGKPSRRQYSFGLDIIDKPVLPSMVSPIINVAIAIDTSYSMGPEEFDEALAEVGGILKATKCNLHFIAFDCAVHVSTAVSGIADVKRKLVGRGGTDFNPVFKELPKIKNKPNILVILSDGCGPAPATPPPGIKVIWVLCGSYSQHPYFEGQPFGEVIEVKREEN